ncbi:hypothetical protein VNI00_013885 [Paramarasmius palmivorus]|uniref:Rap-GAP domain-containing protein n=1 Tax=Paramarasmius palmivorus TaxID=297713 RepID=A0AAW0BXJ0_9AGAR
MKHESRCLQYIAHGIYVAFEDDSRAFGSPGPTTEELRAESGQRFTHIVQIVNSEPTPIITYFTNQNKTRYLRLSTKRHSHHRYELQMSVLTRDPELHDMSPEQADLFLGATYYTTEKMFMPGAEGVARLRPKQMVAAREFIRLSGAASSAGRISPRVLITAPRDHRTDIISIVACFLSATSGKCAAEVVNSINNQREMKTVWQGCVSRKGVEYIQGLAWE